ncbi:SDR family NAD(P)-dependent oxidoreductase [Halococcus dombrowskii]|uniref:3-hydroxybutyrate dehydrogenase n=1 Tax=Halococcus dombrowskii TaxID=179637 RepID=A0AAV3SFV6_HALDO|nr:SDR family NAD(P)-dependent oxidoreductase [Halococcus dombrowskii]UOO94700.1 SDR family NAD(P)-dependent oxidoreductase [Halococcus dombrowskii]
MTDPTEPPELRRDDVLTLDDARFVGDNVALVTGAGSGIGRATALALAHNGLTAVATDIDEDGLDETVAKHDALDLDGTVETVAGDLTDDDDIDHVIERAADCGQITFLANIAGLQTVAPIEEFPMEKYDMMQEAMLRAPLALTKGCLPHMHEGDGGAVGNMCSIHGHYVTRDKVAYNMMKFGLRGLTQSIAAEGDGDVRAFSFSTAYVKTPLVTDQIADTAEERGISEQEVVEDVMLGEARVKEMMDPIEVANVFTMGFSEHASHLDGGDLLFDGGYTLTY